MPVQAVMPSQSLARDCVVNFGAFVFTALLQGGSPLDHFPGTLVCVGAER